MFRLDRIGEFTRLVVISAVATGLLCVSGTGEVRSSELQAGESGRLAQADTAGTVETDICKKTLLYVIAEISASLRYPDEEPASEATTRMNEALPVACDRGSFTESATQASFFDRMRESGSSVTAIFRSEERTGGLTFAVDGENPDIGTLEAAFVKASGE